MFESIRLLVDAIFGARAVRKDHERAIRELHNMTDKELLDIGVKRYDIERVVREASR